MFYDIYNFIMLMFINFFVNFKKSSCENKPFISTHIKGADEQNSIRAAKQIDLRIA